MLDLKALGCRDPRSFPFLTPPPPSHMTAALLDLALLGGTRPSLPYLMAAEETTRTMSASSSFSSSVAAAAVALSGSTSAIIRAASSTSEVKMTPPPPFDVLAALSADAAVAPLTPLGKLMADLPVEPPVRY